MASCISLRLFAPITKLQENVKHYISFNYAHVKLSLPLNFKHKKQRKWSTSFPGSFASKSQGERGKKDPGSGSSRASKKVGGVTRSQFCLCWAHSGRTKLPHSITAWTATANVKDPEKKIHAASSNVASSCRLWKPKGNSAHFKTFLKSKSYVSSYRGGDARKFPPEAWIIAAFTQ